MPTLQTYAVRYFDEGRTAIVEEFAQAESEQQVRAMYSHGGCVLLGLWAKSATVGRTHLKTSDFDVSSWCRELRTLLVAGMTVVEALDTLRAQSQGGVVGAVQAGLARSLAEGQALSRAMALSGKFPQVLIASVTASERTSALPAALADFLVYDELISKLKRQVVSAAVYPAVVVTLGLLITMFLLVFVIPRFSRMYVSFKGAVSAPTQALLWLSDALQNHTAILLAIFASAVALFVWSRQSGWIAVWF